MNLNFPPFGKLFDNISPQWLDLPRGFIEAAASMDTDFYLIITYEEYDE